MGVVFSNNRNSENGFTIVELMIATAVFSLVLMISSLAIIHVGRMYYKGVIMNRTQDVSRKVIDDLTTSIQFEGHTNYSVGSNGNSMSRCIGKNRYTYNTDAIRGTSAGKLRHVLWKDTLYNGAPCLPVDLSEETPSGGSFGVELLGENMRLPEFEVSKDPITNIWSVSITVSYGEDNDFEPGSDFKICRGLNAGGQFCSVSSYSTKIKGRL